MPFDPFWKASHMLPMTHPELEHAHPKLELRRDSEVLGIAGPYGLCACTIHGMMTGFSWGGFVVSPPNGCYLGKRWGMVYVRDVSCFSFPQIPIFQIDNGRAGSRTRRSWQCNKTGCCRLGSEITVISPKTSPPCCMGCEEAEFAAG